MNEICIGNGVRDPEITMLIDPAQRSLSINGLRGEIDGADPWNSSELRELKWRHGLIRYSTIIVSALTSIEGYYLADLYDGSRNLEFLCRA